MVQWPSLSFSWNIVTITHSCVVNNNKYTWTTDPAKPAAQCLGGLVSHWSRSRKAVQTLLPTFRTPKFSAPRRSPPPIAYIRSIGLWVNNIYLFWNFRAVSNRRRRSSNLASKKNLILGTNWYPWFVRITFAISSALFSNILKHAATFPLRGVKTGRWLDDADPAEANL